MPDRAVEDTLRRADVSRQVGAVGGVRGATVTKSPRNLPGVDGSSLEDPGAAAQNIDQIAVKDLTALLCRVSPP